MASSEQNGSQGDEGSSPVGWVQEQYRKIKENAETYPYVWASYIMVYGGFSLWMTYRYRKLRRTEDRVRVLQQRLRDVFEAEESAASSSASVEKSSPEKSNPAK